jgi:Family of unknown function (DUF5317)
MVLALAVALGVILGCVLGGRVSALATMPIRAPWLFYVAIGLQVAGYPSGVLPWSVGNSLATGFWLVSYAVLIAAAAVNLRLPGAAVVGLGMFCNLAAVLANGGHMPALRSALRAAGVRYRGVHNNSAVAVHPHLAWLIDRWPVPAWIPMGNVYSVGDVLIAAGAVVLVCAGMGVRLRRRPLEAGVPEGA